MSLTDGTTKQKVHGHTDGIVGGIQKTVGAVVDAVTPGHNTPQLKRDGEVKQEKGNAKVKTTETRAYGEGVGKGIKGLGNDLGGKLTNDTTQELKGKEQMKEGEVERAVSS